MIDSSDETHLALKASLSPQAATVLAALLGFATFSLNYIVEKRLDSLEVFEQYNIIFDTDPNTRLSSISHGWGNRSLIHPHFSNVFSLPIRSIARFANVFGLSVSQEGTFRRSLGLMVVPLCSGLTASTLFFIFRHIGLSAWRSSFATCLGSISFSQMVFGSVPEHFAVSGLALALCYLLAAEDLRRRGPIRWPAWIAAGVFTMGITATNIVAPIILLFACVLRRGQGVIVASKITTFYAVIVLVATYTSALVCAAMFGDMQSLLSRTANASFVEAYWTGPFHKVLRLPEVVLNTIVPTNVDVIPNTIRGHGERHCIQFTLDSGPQKLPIMICVGLLASGTIGWFHGVASYRLLAIAAVAILGMNLAMHCFFGNELFLYSQHWLTSLLVLFAGNLAYDGFFRDVCVFVFGVLLVSVGISNFLWFCFMFSELS